MSETTITAELPDGSFQPCFSPNSEVRSYFKPGQEIPAAEFIRLSRLALNIAPGRSAFSSLPDIERWAGALPPEALITIFHIS